VRSELKQHRIINRLDEHVAAAEQTRKVLEDQLAIFGKTPSA
jgi:hypothetical protein